MRQLFRINRVPVARTGDFVDMSGKQVPLRTATFDEMASNYGESNHLARVTTDHVRSGGANGAVDRAYREGEILYADYKFVPKGSVDAFLGSGAYPNRSIEMVYNVVPGKPYLGGVTHLGAQRPAVKGLPMIKPSQVQAMSDEEMVNFSEFAEANYFAAADFEGGYLKDPEENMADNPTALSDAEVEVKLAEQRKSLEADFAEQQKQMKADFDAKLAEERRVTDAKLAEAKSLADNAEYVRSLSEQGRITAQMESEGGLSVLLSAADSVGEVAIDGQRVKLGDELRKQLSSLPQIRPMNSGGATTSAQNRLAGAPDSTDFGDMIEKRTAEIRKEKPTLSVTEASDMALAEVSNGTV